MPAPRAPEFPRPVEAPRATGRPATHRIAATAEERAALARRFALLSLDRLEAEVRLERLAGGLVRLTASLVVEAVQECVATLRAAAGADRRGILRALWRDRRGARRHHRRRRTSRSSRSKAAASISARRWPRNCRWRSIRSQGHLNRGQSPFSVVGSIILRISVILLAGSR